MMCKTYVQFFGTLGDKTKLEILEQLKLGEKSVSNLCTKLKLEQSRVSHNLRKLKERGFVTSKKNGKNRIYTLDKKIIMPLLKLIDNHVNTYYKHYCECKGEAKKLRWKNSRRN